MKPFISFPVPKLNKWMTSCVLSTTLLGLPMTAVAQEFTTCVMTTDSSVVCGTHTFLQVGNTSWLVETAENGRNSDFHEVPWVFSQNGTVRAGDLWQGSWQVESEDTISVTIRMNGSSVTDQFTVRFHGSTNFTAYKNGRAYRYGISADGQG